MCRNTAWRRSVAGSSWTTSTSTGESGKLPDHMLDFSYEQPVPASVLEGCKKIARLADWQWKRLLVHQTVLLIADAVSAPPDGKFYIHGGGLTRLTVPVLPFVVPQIGAFVRLEIDEDEVGQEHEFRFALTDPDGVPVGLWPSCRAELPPPPSGAPELEEGEQRFVVLAINIPGIQLGRRGLHRFEFHVDGECGERSRSP
jgi:hypothetical protein